MSLTAVHPTTHLSAPARFDVHEVEAFTARAAAAPGHLVVDLGAVRFVDVAGLNALLAARSEALDAGHDLLLSEVSPAARITLELAGLDEAFPLVDELVVAA